MITIEQAYEIVVSEAIKNDAEQVDLNDSLGRILRQDVVADMNMPPFDKSAVDGYACRLEDLDKPLEIIEIIQAGVVPKNKITAGECAKIMTGAMIPEGANTIVMVEDADENLGIVMCAPKLPKTNICLLGEDVNNGTIIIKQGVCIEPQHIAVMATFGCSQPWVAKKPSVGVISTGDELVEPNRRPKTSQIRNSNAYQLIAQITKVGAIPDYAGIAIDAKKNVREAILKTIANNDIVLLSGGVSKGDFDYIPLVLKELGFEIMFHYIAVQPGHPTLFAKKGNKYCFGLPGNPVSSFVQFLLLVKPLIISIMDGEYTPKAIKLPMYCDHTRKKASRKSWIPVIITDEGYVKPVDYNGSAHINALVRADGLIAIPIGKVELKQGEFVDVRQI